VTLKVHVHTDEPDLVVGLFKDVGEVSRLDVADMTAQVAQRSARLAASGAAAEPARCGAVAVASGDGMRALFESLGVRVVDGGATLNPSTYELLAVIHDVDAEEVVVLPNSANVIMAAERAAELSEKAVHVVPTRSQQAGLTISVEMATTRGAAENAAAMGEALARLRTGGVAPAAREDPQGRFAVGDAVGFVDDALVAWGEPEPTLRTVLEARRWTATRSPAWCPRASRSRSSTAASPPGGGSSPPSSEPRLTFRVVATPFVSRTIHPPPRWAQSRGARLRRHA
jgi:dihydroxyacetone kinase-like predicted kinase